MKNYHGCDLLLYAEIENDDAMLYRASKPERLGALRGVVIPQGKAVNVIYKDGLPLGMYHTENQNLSVQIDTEGLDESFISYLTGQGENGDGFYIDTGENIKRYFALGFRLLETNGNYKYTWYLKGFFQLQQKTVNTKQGTETIGDTLLFFPMFTNRKFNKNGKVARSITIDGYKINRDINGDYWSGVVWTPDNLLGLATPLILPDTNTLNVGDNVVISGQDSTSIEYEVIE